MEKHLRIYMSLTFLLSIWAIGESTRFLYQGIFLPEQIYHPIQFDLGFDWAPLLILGLPLLVLSIYHLGWKSNAHPETND